ncbi:MAG: LysM peptidoglycan-binding domain-containing protein [Bacteroidales bacterium]|nr:LysM peptidoglycan-binding domain-containing protein [Bacteroidales bacterium]
MRILRDIFLVALFAMGTTIYAQEIVTEGGKAYKLYTVQKSEGLYRVSVNNGTTQEEILAANPQIRETGLVEGMQIRIPMKQVAGMNIPSTASGVTSTYTVQKGETVSSISRKFEIKISDFYALNPECLSGLSEGQVVKIPSTVATTSGHLVHKMQLGETLYSIAKRYGVTTQDIQTANQAVDVNSIPVGSTIRVPVSALPAEDEYFIYHRIAKDETLYSLCLKYDILLDKIKARNPDLDASALSVGQIVVIDKKVEKKEDIIHEVEKKETLYSITHKYNVSYDELAAANPDQNLNDLKKGMKIRIPQRSANYGAKPITEEYVVETASKVDSTNLYDYRTVSRPTINVALMLPFDADIEMRQINETGNNYEKSTYYFRSRRCIEFYEGVKMALDTLAAQGVNTKLTVIDVNNRLDAQNQIQKLKASGNKPDLIFGPAHSDEIHDVAVYAQENHIPVVLPFAQSDSLLNEIPYMFQALRVDTITTPEIARCMVDQCDGKNVILLASISRSKSDIYRLHKVQEMCRKKGIEPRLFTFNTRSPEKFLEVLSPDKENVLIMTCTDEAKAGSILAAVANILDQKKDTKLQMICTSEWLAYQSVDVDVYHKLNTLVISSFALDYSDVNTLRVLSNYRKNYFAEPVAFTPYFHKSRSQSGYSTYALWGYDLATLFVGARVQYGPNFFRRINDYKVNLTQSNFKFKHVTAWGGAVNVGFKTINFTPQGTIVVKDL